jgi:hypothetical protein
LGNHHSFHPFTKALQLSSHRQLPFRDQQRVVHGLLRNGLPVIPEKLCQIDTHLPSGKHTKNYGKSQFLMGKLTISMAMFNSFLYVDQRVASFNHGKKVMGCM